MIEVLFTTIPEGIGILFWIGGLIGIIVFSVNSIQKTKWLALIALILYMMLWRAAVNISSSRYCAVLIILFTLFFSRLLKNVFPQNLFTKTCIILLLIFVAIYCFIKTYHIKDHDPSYAISELYQREDRNPVLSSYLVTQKDFHRVQILTNTYSEIEPLHYDSNKLDNLIQESIKTPKRFVVDFISDASLDEIRNSLNGKIKLCFKKKNGAKRRNYVWEYYTPCSFRIVSYNQPYSIENNLLINGDFEQIDSVEESQKKLKRYLKDYSQYAKHGDVRTAFNTYYYTGEDIRTLYDINISDIEPIGGRYSAYIKCDGLYCLYFMQKIPPGAYECSFVVQGTPATNVSLFRNTTNNSGRAVTTELNHTIENKLVYMFTTRFYVEPTSPNDFFLLGIWVNKGSAKIDNVSLKPIQEKAS